MFERGHNEANRVLQHVRIVARLPSIVDGTGFGVEVIEGSKSEKVEWNSGLPVGDALLVVLNGLI
jgi:hypothetical protein